MNKLMKKLIGTKDFYKVVLATTVPIAVQMGITNFVSLLDNIMVGQLGTEPMSGVSIVNQLIFVFQLCVFGASSGAGIFTAQFHGSQNHEGVRSTFQFKMIICTALALITMLVLKLFGPELINLYLHDEGQTGNLELTLEYAKRYLSVTLLWLIPHSIAQSYSSTLRETGKTLIPMISGVVAVFVNMALNYLLIFGKLGFPEMGVEGAALATAISRFVECGIIISWTHMHHELNPFAVGAYRKLDIPRSLVKQITIKGMPLLVNEGLWSFAMATITQCYSVRGLAAVAALNICSVINGFFTTIFQSLGNAISILVGQKLGAGKMDEARDDDIKLIFFSVASCLVMSTLMVLLAPLFCSIYNVTEEVNSLAITIIRIAALSMPIQAFVNAAYFTLRSGGKTIVTFFFDSVYAWTINVPLAFVLSRFTSLPMALMYFCCQFIDLVKCTIGFILVKRGHWIHNIVSND